MIIYTDKFIPAKSQGIAVGPIAFIRPEFKYDIGLRVHEQTHIDQYWRALAGLLWIGKLGQELTLEREVEAYRDQMKAYKDGKDRVHNFAVRIATLYGLSISVEEAEYLLTK